MATSGAGELLQKFRSEADGRLGMAKSRTFPMGDFLGSI